MWRTYPKEGRVESWIEQGMQLDLAREHGEGEGARSRAPSGRAAGRRPRPCEAAAIAERQGDADLHALALTALAFEASRAGEYDQAHDSRQALAGACGRGSRTRTSPATRLPRRGPRDGRCSAGSTRPSVLTADFGRISEQLTPHHRVHGIAVACELEEFSRRLGPGPRARAHGPRAGRRQRRDPVRPQRTVAPPLRPRARPRGRRRWRPSPRGAGERAMDGGARARAGRADPAAGARAGRPGRGRAPARRGGSAQADDLVHLVGDHASSTGSERSGASSSSRR